MAQIIVTAGTGYGVEEGTVMLQERVNATDFESDRFTSNLLERLGWAVEDANAAEQREAVDGYVPQPPEPDRAELQPDWDREPIGVA